MEQYSPRIQKKRDEIAQHVKGLRKSRDEARALASKTSSRIRAFFKGQNELNDTADMLNRSSRDVLIEGKELLVHAEKVETLEKKDRLKYVLSAGHKDYFKEENEAELLVYLEANKTHLRDLLLQKPPSPSVLGYIRQVLWECSRPTGNVELEDTRFKLMQFILDNLQEAIPGIDETMEDTGSDDWFSYFDTLSILYEGSSDYIKKEVLQVITKHRAFLLTRGNAVRHTFPFFLRYGDSESVKEVDKLIKEMVDQDSFDVLFMLASLARSHKQEDRQIGESYLEQIISKYDLDPKKTLDAWLQSVGESFYFLPKHVLALKSLEEKKPGAAKVLVNEFGVYDFGRYPVDLLVKQVEDKENVDMPYGIVVFPRTDYNGAFMQDHDVIGKFAETLPGNYGLRFFETESLMSLGRILITLDRKYGGRNKISFAVMGGHGEKELISFSGVFGYPKRGNLFQEDVDNANTDKIKEFFSPDATLMLLSCSTGAEEGIGQALSKNLGLKVIAPNVPTSAKDISAHLSTEGRLEFSVRYNNTESGTLYQSGNKVV